MRLPTQNNQMRMLRRIGSDPLLQLSINHALWETSGASAATCQKWSYPARILSLPTTASESYKLGLHILFEDCGEIPRITSGLRPLDPQCVPSETCFAMIPGTAYAKAVPQPYEGMRGYV